MTFTINELSGYAWETAIRKIIGALELDPSKHIQEWSYYHRIAENLNLTFDVNGNLI